jgi:hypothetical protein
MPEFPYPDSPDSEFDDEFDSLFMKGLMLRSWKQIDEDEQEIERAYRWLDERSQ